MNWISTYTGRKFFPLEPRAEDVDIRDIAHSLSLTCRFNGHTKAFYSVADHSVRVAKLLESELALWGLLHDSAEAYVTDLPRPLKKQMPDFQAAEDRVLRVIVTKFGLSWPMPEQVRLADDTLLVTECRDIMRGLSEPMGIISRPLTEQIIPATPEQSEVVFLRLFNQLNASPVNAVHTVGRKQMATEREKQFHAAMLEIYQRAQDEAKYNATRFLHMVGEKGGLATAKLLLHASSVSDGYTALWERNRLDLTVEATILRPEWHDLFTDEERQIAKKRLAEYGYKS